MTNLGSTVPTRLIPVCHWTGSLQPHMLRGKLRSLNHLRVLCFIALSGRRTKVSYGYAPAHDWTRHRGIELAALMEMPERPLP